MNKSEFEIILVDDCSTDDILISLHLFIYTKLKMVYSYSLMYDLRIMLKILLYLEDNFDGIKHPSINENTYDLNNYCVHAYLEDGTNYIDVYKKFEKYPIKRLIIGKSMNFSKSDDVIRMLQEYYQT